MPVVKLNQRFLEDGLRCPLDKSRVEFVCDQTPGFFVETRQKSEGVGTFYFRFRDTNHKSRTIKLGRTDVTRLQKARNKAIEMRKQLEQGIDPLANHTRFKTKPTFSQFFENEYMSFARTHKRTADGDWSMYRHLLKAEFGELLLDQIKRKHVESMMQKLKQLGRSGSTIDHYAKLVRRVLNYAIEREVIESNPLQRIRLIREDNRKEVLLNDEDLNKLVKVLLTHPNRAVCELMLFLLYTGCRLSEGRLAKWSDVDIENKLFQVVATNSKSKRRRHVPLNASALEVLEGIRGRHDCEFVFPNPATLKPYVCLKKSWKSIKQTAGLPQLRIHDLRHVHASLLINQGHSLYKVQRALGHSSSQVTERYSHLAQSQLQSASESVSDCIRATQSGADRPRPRLRVVGSGKN